jgi:hypothetical protein
MRRKDPSLVLLPAAIPPFDPTTRPAPHGGWAANPHAVHMLAVLYLLQNGIPGPRYETAARIAAAWLADQEPTA